MHQPSITNYYLEKLKLGSETNKKAILASKYIFRLTGFAINNQIKTIINLDRIVLVSTAMEMV